MATIRRKLKGHRFSGKLGVFRREAPMELFSSIFFEEFTMQLACDETERDRKDRMAERLGRRLLVGDIFMIIGDQYTKDTRYKTDGHRKNCKCGACYHKGSVVWCTVLTADGFTAAILAKNIKLYEKP